MSERVFNFGAGPAVLPEPVLAEVQRDLMALPGVGISVLEISHRSKTFDVIIEETEARLRRVLSVPDDVHVLFLQGGGQLQFSMVPINFLERDRSADYVLTGSWGTKAIAEAKREGGTRVAWSGKDAGFRRVPADAELALDQGARYLHYTSNETIEGVQFQAAPHTGGVPLVCDASSDFLSRPIDLARPGLTYACAQKNAGPSGLTVVLVSESFLATRREGLHSMLDYRQFQEAGSRLNTPNVFGVYLHLLVLRWIEETMGGLEKLTAHNQRKARILYDALDADSDFYRPHAEKASRSVMNVTFRLPSDELDKEFLRKASERGLAELKGHRSVGGIRASIYNAMPVAGVEALRDFMVAFRKTH
jgi:phosphoserine aminotransferase